MGRLLFINRDPAPESSFIDLLVYWVQIAQLIDEHDPFLSRYQLHNGRLLRKKLHRRMISEALKVMADHFGLDRLEFSSHSLRIGGATAAAIGGISDAVVKRIGGWSLNSESHQGYSRATQHDHGPLSIMLSQSNQLTVDGVRQISSRK